MLLALTLIALPAVEGWWPPDAPWPHPSGLPRPARNAAAATVSLGAGRSGAFVHRDGLIVTSARAVRECVALHGLRRRFVAREHELGLPCPDLVASVRLDVRDVTRTVDASEQAGSTDVREALVSACRRRGRRHRCRIVTTEDGRTRLLDARDLGEVRLRFWPGPTLTELGGPARDLARPRLRIDAALLSIKPGRRGVPAVLAIGDRIVAEQDVWVYHHPQPTLRWRAALEAELFVDEVLPVYERRAHTSSEFARARVASLQRGAARGVKAARWEALRTLRGRDRGLSLVDGRAALRAAPWSIWARTAAMPEQRPPLFGHWARGLPQLPIDDEAPRTNEALRAWTDGHARRVGARLGYAGSPVGPDGQGDLRVSRGCVMASQPSWSELRTAAIRLATVTEDVLFGPRGRIGFELRVDIGPFTTGGPVLDGDGRLLGVVSGGDQSTRNGAYRFDPAGVVSVTRWRALMDTLETAPDGLDWVKSW